MNWSMPWAARASSIAVLALASGCAPKIGDSCSRDLDCAGSATDRRCDKSQPGGYCTTFGCNANACADTSVCVLYNAAVPGCMYDDREPARVGRSFCMASCEEDSDCRDGYVCLDPRATPWNASILDTDTSRRICSVAASYARSMVDAPVCGGGLPMTSARLDAGVFATPTLGDAGAQEEGRDAGVPPATDAGLDAGVRDASVPAAADAGPDAGVPAAADSGIDAGPSDASS